MQTIAYTDPRDNVLVVFKDFELEISAMQRNGTLLLRGALTMERNWQVPQRFECARVMDRECIRKVELVIESFRTVQMSLVRKMKELVTGDAWSLGDFVVPPAFFHRAFERLCRQLVDTPIDFMLRNTILEAIRTLTVGAVTPVSAEPKDFTFD